jgi:hypothetical protein
LIPGSAELVLWAAVPSQCESLPGSRSANSPFVMPSANAAHSWTVKMRRGPSGSLLSRTATAPPGSAATSTQLPPLLLALALRHVRSSARPLVRSSARPLVRSSARPLVRSSARPLVRSSARPGELYSLVAESHGSISACRLDSLEGVGGLAERPVERICPEITIKWAPLRVSTICGARTGWSEKRVFPGYARRRSVYVY